MKQDYQKDVDIAAVNDLKDMLTDLMLADPDDDPSRYKSLSDIIHDWSSSPVTIGVAHVVYTDLLRRIHFHKPTFAPDDLKDLVKTGRGLCLLPKSAYENIKFRNLLLYDKVTNDFLDPVADENENPPANNGTVEVMRCRANEEAAPVTRAQTTNSTDIQTKLPVVDVNEFDDDDDGYSIDGDDEDEDDDDMETICVGEVEFDPSYAGDGGVPLSIEEVAAVSDGVELQMQYEEENKVGVQEMAYFGIENVLTGIHPGLRNDMLLLNSIRALAVLEEGLMSDTFVNFLFQGIRYPVIYLKQKNILIEHVIEEQLCFCIYNDRSKQATASSRLIFCWTCSPMELLYSTLRGRHLASQF